METFPDGTVWVKEFVNQSGVNTVFTSHEMDVETKFFYAKARYYDAQLGRFISVDPIIGSYLPTGDRKRDANMPGYGGFYNPVNINMYSYGANNPLKFVDPDGEYIIDRFNFMFREKKYRIRFHNKNTVSFINKVKYLPSGGFITHHVSLNNPFTDTYYDSQFSNRSTGISITLGIIGSLPEAPLITSIGTQFTDWLLTMSGNKSEGEMEIARSKFLEHAGLNSDKYLSHWNKKYLKSFMDLVDLDIFVYEKSVKGTKDDKGFENFAKEKSMIYKKVYLPKLKKYWKKKYCSKDPR